MPTDRAVAAREAANSLVPDVQSVAFATALTAATIPAHINEVYVSVANDVTGVLTVSPRRAFSQLLIHVGSISSSGVLEVSYNGVTYTMTAFEGTDVVITSTGGQLAFAVTPTAFVALVEGVVAS
jgi:hypothetical protein